MPTGAPRVICGAWRSGADRSNASAATADLLIRDKLTAQHWDSHLGHGDSLFVNAATWALLLGDRLVDVPDGAGLGVLLHRLVARLGEPAIRVAVRRVMVALGETFVLGRDLEEATRRAAAQAAECYRHSYDMLGEAARTRAEADAYQAAYHAAIHSAGRATGSDLQARPGVSVKLSAPHPCYECVLQELLPRLLALCSAARDANLSLTLDAEEAERLLLQIELLQAVSAAPALADWQGLGLAVQAYQKRAPALLDYLDSMAKRHRRRLLVRLVKGAYWDTEIKHSQVLGLAD
ncbi:MAG: proline dehydrogenase family protein [Gammaproteobacteria bacterium]|nr:proline dehydrogenase family protein [Gammaproteobacteria bacterium]